MQFFFIWTKFLLQIHIQFYQLKYIIIINTFHIHIMSRIQIIHCIYMNISRHQIYEMAVTCRIIPWMPTSEWQVDLFTSIFAPWRSAFSKASPIVCLSFMLRLLKWSEVKWMIKWIYGIVYNARELAMWN